MRQDNSTSRILIEIFVLVILVLLTFYFRCYHASLGTFEIDRARDMRFAQHIATGKTYPLLGPIAGAFFYLGPLYYYLLSLPLFFTSKITAPYYFIACLNAFSFQISIFLLPVSFPSVLADVIILKVIGLEVIVCSVFWIVCSPARSIINLSS